MSYGDVNIVQFTGLNSNVASELIPDGAARDLYNFRMEKVGKLVSRDGNIIGLMVPTRRSSDADPDYPGEIRYGNDRRITSYQSNGGIIGMGELILEEKWDRIDSDRFMVYAIRGTRMISNIEGEDYANYRHRQVFLLSPVTGEYKNQLFVWQYTEHGNSVNDVIDQVDNLPMGNGESTHTMNAPNRLIPGNTMTDPDAMGHDSRTNAQFIDNYIAMNQYRHKLVISDRTNGDMLLEDEFERKDIDPWLSDGQGGYDHKLHLRPNSLATFDIDIVDLDARLDVGEENDGATGVENGMGLYGYELDKSTALPTNDHYTPSIGDEDWYYDKKNKATTIDQIEAFIDNGAKETMLYLLDFEMSWNGKDSIQLYNSDNKYRFTNRDAGEYDDVAKPLVYHKAEVKNKDGKIEESISPDVEVWDDFTLPYYPCHGIDNESPYYFMRSIDREFDKLQAGLVKSFELNDKTNAGNKVPLGIWRYRYVWDFGNGIYSAPSAEILCPDLLWSAVPDAYTDNSGITGPSGTYIRPMNYVRAELEKSMLPERAPYNSTGVYMQHPTIFKQDGDITKFGELYFALTQKLYSGLEHRFAGKTATTIPDLLLQDAIDKYEFGTTVTIMIADKVVEMPGWIWEGAAIAHTGTWNGLISSIPDDSEHYVVINKGHLVVPIFQSGDSDLTYNSLFDDHGRLRTSYRNLFGPYTQLVFPGSNNGLYTGAENALDIHDVIFAISGADGRIDSNLYLNIIAQEEDLNNDEMGEYSNNNFLRDLRPNTLIRCTDKEIDMMSWVAEDVPANILNRLVLKGEYAIPIVSPTNDIFDKQQVGVEHQRDDAFNAPYEYPLAHDALRYGRSIARWQASTGTENDAVIRNLEVIVYGEADRFIGVEQLTSYFPSSLLFKAPRIAHKIKAEDIPLKAKKLLVFRTKSSHSNDWDPNTYGLVEEVEIKRDSQYNVITDMPEGGQYAGLYFFDDIKDDDLDFGMDVLEFEGLRTQLKSAYNIALNERMYYLNFEESFQPMEPRKGQRDEAIATGTFRNTNMASFDSTDETGFDSPKTLRYRYLYEFKAQDGAAVLSDYKDAGQISVDGTSTPKVVVLFYLPSQYDASIERLKVYRETDHDGHFYYIGEVKPEDEGVFVDNALVDGPELEEIKADVQNYESGMRWSEPYRPDWIKSDSFAEYKSGDGKQITGVDSQYGNLVIFKETSIHRTAVQGQDVPISRTDEITPEIGLIAPLAKINVNNMLYFLSWKGLMAYDNNVLQPLDATFQDELQFVMRNAGDSIRDASCGYNSRYSEIYLNMPMLPTKEYNMQDIYGEAEFHEHTRRHYGHIYVVNLEKQYATKFGNFPSHQAVGQQNADGDPYWLRCIGDTRQLIRMYYNNSLGEMRSADILPVYYGKTLLGGDETAYGDGYPWAGIYIETPYSVNDILYRDTDVIFDPRTISANVARVSGDWREDVISAWNWNTTVFPPEMAVPIYNMFKSKFITGGSETITKRVRKTLVNIYAAGEITLSGIVIPEEDYDERIDNLTFALPGQTFTFPPSRTSFDPLTGGFTPGTDKNVLSFIPQHPSRVVNNQGYTAMRAFDDFLGKPIRYSVEISASGRTQINAIVIYFRPIHTYVR